MYLPVQQSKKKKKNPRAFWMCQSFLLLLSDLCRLTTPNEVVCGVAKIFSTSAAGRGAAAMKAACPRNRIPPTAHGTGIGSVPATGWAAYSEAANLDDRAAAATEDLANLG
jgi:hypothetical protein